MQNLTRYDLANSCDCNCHCHMMEQPEGVYVKFYDIEKILTAHNNARDEIGLTEGDFRTNIKYPSKSRKPVRQPKGNKEAQHSRGVAGGQDTANKQSIPLVCCCGPLKSDLQVRCQRCGGHAPD